MFDHPLAIVAIWREFTQLGYPSRGIGGIGRPGRLVPGGALLRDTDGFALTMVPLSQLEAITEVARTAVAALLAAAALSRGQVRPAELGQFAWLAVFDDDDRAEFFNGPKWPGYSKTIHYEITSAGRIDYQFNPSATEGVRGDPHGVVKIRSIDLGSH
jgi:hypothetical protein